MAGGYDKEYNRKLHKIPEDARILVRREGRNDGLMVWRSTPTSKTKPFDMVCIAPFYESDQQDDDGKNILFWRSTKKSFPKPMKTFFQYQIVNIEKKHIPDLISALMQIGECTPNKVEMTDPPKKKSDVWDKAKDVLGM